MEFIFSIENVFVFHFVVRAFRIPRRHAQKALMCVVLTQILLQMVFFIGLAYYIASLKVLPYVLGMWLVYVGYEAAREHSHAEIDFKQTWVWRATKTFFGKRLHDKYDADVSYVFWREDRLHVTMLFVASVCLVLVDAALEVDVTLTKIESLQNHYLAFTSSAVASFALPELFFVSRDLFARYYLLKYGISFVLAFFGMQLLFHELVTLSTLIQVLIVIAVMIACVVMSIVLGLPSTDLDADREDGMDDEWDETADKIEDTPRSHVTNIHFI
jgi:tellurite resistance protein TerC